MEMMKASNISDELALKFWSELFGRHPGIQLLTIADMGARWINSHPKEYRENAMNAIIQAMLGLATIDQKNEQTGCCLRLGHRQKSGRKLTSSGHGENRTHSTP
jgi:hypothetical protein